MGDLTESLTASISPIPTPSNPRTLPIREDCWSEEATSTLVDAWGNRYLELNRGNLRQKDWQDVADSVNSLHGHTKKTHRTDVQCKNRIDTIKKRYKAEKSRVVSSNGTLTSSWIFFERMDSLIGSTFPANKNAVVFTPPPPPSSPPVAVPLAIALPEKRPAAATDGGGFRRNYSAMAAAAAAAAETESEEEEEEEAEEGMGIGKLARAIERFGEVYEKVEREKLRQMVDLEKQRMKFAKDLEMERMRIFTETQIQLERIKRSRVNGKVRQQQLQHQQHWRSSGSNGEMDY